MISGGLGGHVPAEHHEPNRKLAIKNGSVPRLSFRHFASLLESFGDATDVGLLLRSKRDGENSLEGLLIHLSKDHIGQHWKFLLR